MKQSASRHTAGIRQAVAERRELAGKLASAKSRLEQAREQVATLEKAIAVLDRVVEG